MALVSAWLKMAMEHPQLFTDNGYHVSWNYYIASLLFVLASATDFFDGYIAREWNQSTLLGAILDPLADKFKAFNWDVSEVDGHCLTQLLSTLSQAKANRSGKPKCVIAHTVKGKGVSFMENKLAWHYKSPSEADYQTACLEIEAA